MTTITTASATTTEFQTALSLQSKKPTAKSITNSLADAPSETAEARYWAEKFALGTAQGSRKKYAHPRLVKLQAGTASMVHQVLFGPPAVDNKIQPLAVVAGPRVRLYGTTSQSSLQRNLSKHNTNSKENTVEADRQVPTGGHLATAAAFRHDGRLLAIATQDGQILVADTYSRATLCRFNVPSRLAVRVVTWFRNGQHILAAGDDGTTRVYTIAKGAISQDKPTIQLTGHGDSIRCAQLWQPSVKDAHKWPHKALAFTGSYDHTIRIWNLDDIDNSGSSNALTDRCLSVLSHEGPVESLMLLPSQNDAVPVWLVAAGGTKLNVFHPLTGKCVCSIQARHRKTITSLLTVLKKNPETDEVRLRLFTAGLDGLVRVHSWDGSTGQVRHLHGINLGFPISSLCVDEDSNRIAIGSIDGSVRVRQKGPSIISKKRSREPMAGTYAFFTRGMNATASADDYVLVDGGKKKKLQKYDISLKQFRYGDALDDALGSRIPQVVVAVLEELGKRRGLFIALSNRDEESLEPILSFLVRYIARPRFTRLLVGVANKLIEIYGEMTGQSETIDELFLKLRTQVTLERKAQQQLMIIVGQLDGIMAAGENASAE